MTAGQIMEITDAAAKKQPMFLHPTRGFIENCSLTIAESGVGESTPLAFEATWEHSSLLREQTVHVI